MNWEKITYGTFVDNVRRHAESYVQTGEADEPAPVRVDEEFTRMIYEFTMTEAGKYEWTGIIHRVFADGLIAWVQADHHIITGKGPFITNMFIPTEFREIVKNATPEQRFKGRVEAGRLVALESIAE